MSDRDRSLESGYNNIGADDAGSSFLEDQLDGGGQGHDDDAPRQGARDGASDLQPSERRRSGGLKPMIQRKEKEISDLEDKLLNHREKGEYAYKTEDGRTMFDSVAFGEDQVRLQKLQRELSKMERQDEQYARTSEKRTASAYQAARAYRDREIQKVPENLRPAVSQAFSQIFKSMADQGTFAGSQYAERDAVNAVLGQIMDTAYGNALRRGDVSGPAPSGFDESSGADDRKKDDDAPEEDDFTNNLMYAYDRVKRAKSMTVGEAKRAAREAAKGGQQ